MARPEAVEPRFLPGDRVSVRVASPIGHVRTPYYIRGKTGLVERLCGIYSNPEELAYGRTGEPKQPLYRVRFLQHDVWLDIKVRLLIRSTWRSTSTGWSRGNEHGPRS